MNNTKDNSLKDYFDSMMCLEQDWFNVIKNSPIGLSKLNEIAGYLAENYDYDELRNLDVDEACQYIGFTFSEWPESVKKVNKKFGTNFKL